MNRYKLDDFRPYLYVTTDYGATLDARSTAGMPADAFARVVREDPERRGLLYAGTETGVYVSFDDGARWQPLQRNLPVVPITDLVVKDDDLVVATQGRCVLDPRRHRAAAAARRPEVAGGRRPPLRALGRLPLRRTRGPRARSGKNPPYGARFYYLAEGRAEGRRGGHARDPGRGGRPRARLHVEGGGEGRGRSRTGGRRRLRARPATKPIPAKAGLNRFVWDLRYPHASRFEGMILWGGETDGPAGRAGPLPGAAERRRDDPHPAVRAAQGPAARHHRRGLREAVRPAPQIRDKLTETHDAHRAAAGGARADEGGGRAGRGARGRKAVAEAAGALATKLTAVEEALYQTKNRSRQDPLNFPIRLNNKLAALAGDGRQRATRPRPTRRAPSTRSLAPASTPSGRSSSG